MVDVDGIHASLTGDRGSYLDPAQMAGVIEEAEAIGDLTHTEGELFVIELG